MVVLKIYNADEKDFETPLSTFEVGEHVVGRGSFPNCADKRISRRHILINVKDNEATLTSVHISPIFFMSENSPNVQSIKKDNSVALSDGDKFAFLIDTWYTIKIEKSQNENDLACNNTSTPVSNRVSSNTVAASSSNTVISQSTSCKRGAEDNESYSEERKKLKLLNESLDKLKNNIDKIVSSDYQSNTDCDQGTSSDVVNNDTTEVFKGKDISDSDDEDSDIEMLPEVTRDTEIVNGVQDSLNENAESPNTSVKKSEILDDMNKEPMIEDGETPKIKAEPPEEDSTVGDVNTGENSVADVNTGENSVGEAISAVVKTEDEPAVEVPENNEIVRSDDQEGPTNASASSSRTSNGLKRDKCWYGSNCYRKNPGHKGQFSHPGDSDHEDSDDDDRPQCPYGAQCYRKNPQHRKDYKHPTSRPAPGPSTSNKRKRKRNSYAQSRNTDYDYDTDDSLDEGEPFSADESSSASEVFNDGDSDSDFMEEPNTDDVEDSEEVKMMIKEANKFLRKKR